MGFSRVVESFADGQTDTWGLSVNVELGSVTWRHRCAKRFSELVVQNPDVCMKPTPL